MRPCMLVVAGLAALSWVTVPAPVRADDRPPPELTEIAAGAPVTIRPDRAYLLFRIHRPRGVPAIEPVFMRRPSAVELETYRAARAAAFAEARPGLVVERERVLRRQAEARVAGRAFNDAIPPEPSLDSFRFRYDGIGNVNGIGHNRALERGATDNVYLIEAVPGDYVLYGASWGMGLSSLGVCWCLGTVGFEAPAGTIIDLGTFYFDGAKFESSIPELRDETGFGPSSDTPFVLLAGTMRPAVTSAALPSTLAGRTTAPATYRAVGRFVEPNAGGINRLGPVPGILAYDRGRVIDVATGNEARGGGRSR